MMNFNIEAKSITPQKKKKKNKNQKQKQKTKKQKQKQKQKQKTLTRNTIFTCMYFLFNVKCFLSSPKIVKSQTFESNTVMTVSI